MAPYPVADDVPYNGRRHRADNSSCDSPHRTTDRSDLASDDRPLNRVPAGIRVAASRRSGLLLRSGILILEQSAKAPIPLR